MTPTLTPTAHACLVTLALGGELVRDRDGWWYTPPGEARAWLTQRDAATLVGFQLVRAVEREMFGARYEITAAGREAVG